MLTNLKALAKNEARDWKALVAERRSVYEREARRKQIPRVLVSDGRAFYEGVGAEDDGRHSDHRQPGLAWGGGGNRTYHFQSA